MRGARAPVLADFERLDADLRATYALVPALAYWEESAEPLYLFGRNSAWVWEVTPRRGPATP